MYDNNPHIKRRIGGSVVFANKGINRKKRGKKLGDWAFLIKKAQELRKKPTAAEVIFGRKLQELGVQYIFQYCYNYKGLKGIVDYYLTESKTLIEIDGGYHLEESQQQTDAIKDFVCQNKLKKRILRLTNNQAMYLSIEQIKTLLKG